MHPPPLAFSSSGSRTETAFRSASPKLREVKTDHEEAPVAASNAGGHQGGTSCNIATSQSHPAKIAANSFNNDRRTGFAARPW